MRRVSAAISPACAGCLPTKGDLTGLADFRPWLAMMVKVFRLNNYTLLSLVVEWPRATAHWRTDIYSKVTGVTIPTELVDLVEMSEDRILNYTEFFAPR
jgi:hypothetical protein